MENLTPNILALFVETDPSITDSRWKKWLLGLQNYFMVAKITEAKIKQVVLLH